MKKTCPRDGTQLALVRISGIILDKCHTCDGIWCDYGELKAMRKQKLKEVEDALEHKYGDPEARVVAKDGRMQCPACDGRLMERVYGPHLPMNIDRCDKCFGIWLDEGELDAALGRKKVEATTPTKIEATLQFLCAWFT